MKMSTPSFYPNYLFKRTLLHMVSYSFWNWWTKFKKFIKYKSKSGILAVVCQKELITSRHYMSLFFSLSLFLLNPLHVNHYFNIMIMIYHWQTLCSDLHFYCLSKVHLECSWSIFFYASSLHQSLIFKLNIMWQIHLLVILISRYFLIASMHIPCYGIFH